MPGFLFRQRGPCATELLLDSNHTGIILACGAAKLHPFFRADAFSSAEESSDCLCGVLFGPRLGAGKVPQFLKRQSVMTDREIDDRLWEDRD
jgi:hypothetical protein